MKPIYTNFFKNSDSKDPIEKALNNIPIFENLSPKETGYVKRLVHIRDFKKNETIFKKLAPAEGMYIILEGKIKILELESNVIFANLLSGDFFGELALLDDEPRSATAIATVQSNLIGFFRTDLLTLIKRYPDLGNKILLNLSRVLGERLRRTNQELLKKK